MEGDPARCLECNRSRTEDDHDYSPVQAIFHLPIGWYSAYDGEFCGSCMFDMIRKANS